MCRFSIPVTAQSLRPARDQLREWLRGLHWPADELEDLVYAVSEALANAVEHAYPPAIAAQAWVKVRGLLEPDPTTPAAGGAPQRRVRIEIRDHGRWRPQLTDLTDPGRSRGRGLALMTPCPMTTPRWSGPTPRCRRGCTSRPATPSGA